jgi:hypothetical protein
MGSSLPTGNHPGIPQSMKTRSVNAAERYPGNALGMDFAGDNLIFSVALSWRNYNRKPIGLTGGYGVLF